MKQTQIFLKETGISFHKDMIAAIDGDRKDMTRRLIKPQPSPDWMKNTKQFSPSGKMYDGSDKQLFWLNDPTRIGKEIRCRYGKPGDLLYIRESWFVKGMSGNKVIIGYDKNNPYDTQEIFTNSIYFYANKLNKGNIISSRFMPKEVARKWLIVKEIRVEQLQDISTGDAIREGIKPIHGLAGTYWKDYSRENAHAFNDPILSFLSLWEKINGKGNGEANPFVFVIVFSKTNAPAENKEQ